SEIGARGAATKYGAGHQKRILAMLDRPPTAGYANWTATLLARELGDIHEQYIWRFLRAQKIDLSGRKSWCESQDPEFVPKSADIVGLYLSPSDNAVVLSIDEKPSVLAGQSLKGASFTSVAALMAHSTSFIESYNDTARPFMWTKSTVHQKRLKPC